MSRLLLLFAVALPVLDALAVMLAFFLARDARVQDWWLLASGLPAIAVPTNADYWPYVLLAAGCWVLVAGLQGVYRLVQPAATRLLAGMLWAVLLWQAVYLAVLFLQRSLFFSRTVLLMAVLVAAALLLALRWLQARLAARLQGRPGVVLLGVADAPLRAQIDATYTVLATAEPSLAGLQGALAAHPHCTLVLQVQGGADALADMLQAAREHGAQLHYFPAGGGLALDNVQADDLSGYPFLRITNTPLDGWGRVAKRLADIVGSSLGLVLLSPLLAGVAIAIRASGIGVLYVDTRVGLRGRRFGMMKFQTMWPGSDARRYELGRDDRDDGVLWKMHNDPRVTPLGHWLRRTSIDELPQLWNVLRGDMSLVGPRPHRPEEVAKYQPWQRRLLSVRPGLTSLAAVSGRSDIPFAQEAALDTWYIEHWTLLRDVAIVLRTVWVVLLRRGAR